MGLLTKLGLAPASEVRKLTAMVNGLMRREISSGVESTFGRYEYEKTQALKGSERWDTYDRMESDPEIKASLMQLVAPLTRANWKYESASDSSADKDDADLCNANLLNDPETEYGREYWTETPWAGQRLPEMCDMLRVGYSLFAWRDKVAKGDKGIRRVYQRIKWLEPSSVDPTGWVLDADDNIQAIKRTYHTPPGSYRFLEPLTVDQLTLYIYDYKGARYEGRPFIRSMYGAYIRKEWFLKQAMMAAQKLANPMPFALWPDGYGAENIERMKETAASLRLGDENAYVAAPMGADGVAPQFGFIESKVGEIDRMRGLIDGENGEIARAGFRQSMNLASKSGTGGGRAQAEDMSGTEYMQVEALAALLASQEMHGVANVDPLPRRLVDWNRPGVKAYPRLTYTGLRPDEGKMLEARRIEWYKVGPRLPEIDQAIAKGLEYEIPDDAFIPPKSPPMVTGIVPASADTAPGGTAVIPATGAAAAPIAPAPISRLAMGPPPKGYSRHPDAREKHVALAAIDGNMKLWEQRYYAAASSVLRDMERDVVSRVKRGVINAANYASLFKGMDGPDIKFRARLKATIAGILAKTVDYGQGEMRGELGRRALALPSGRAAVRVTSDEIDTVAQIDVSALVGRLEQEIVGELQSLYAQGLTDSEVGSALEQFIKELSDKPIGLQGREAVTRAFNLGRNLEIQDANIESVVRTEILDVNTCDPCAALDAAGTVIPVNSAAYWENMPPAKCDGGGKCRGFYVPA